MERQRRRREGEYPVLGLLLLAIGSVMVLGIFGMWDEEAKAEQASRELTGATGNFSSPTIIRSYESTDASATGARSYDASTLTTNKDRFEDLDVTALNRTMAARTAHARWTDLFTEGPSPILASLGKGWDLIEATSEQWTGESIAEMRAAHRHHAVITKILHLKRPSLVPVSIAWSSISSVAVGRASNRCWSICGQSVGRTATHSARSKRTS